MTITHRDLLLRFVRKQLKSVKGDSLEARLLREAEEGLRALDYGEVQSLFAPRSKAAHKDGTKPFTLRKLRMQALGFLDLLIKMKYSGKSGAAVRTVAEAFGYKAAAFRKLQQRKKKNSDPVMNSFRQHTASLNLSVDKILDELKKTGSQYISQKKLAKK
jgi:hypothetical protein